MADQKLTELTADTSPTSDDLIYTVTDPAGTPASRKVTIANLFNGLTMKRFVALDPAVQVVSADPAGTGWTSVDITANTSATATAALLMCSLVGGSRTLFVRKTGGGEAQGSTTWVAQHVTSTPKGMAMTVVPLDASQSFDYSVDNADVTNVTIVVRGYWETVA